MKTPITVLGLGAMGTALARAFLAAGHPPTAFTGELLVPWLTVMMASLPGIANDLEYGAAPGAAGSNLAMQAAGFVNLIDASEEQGVDPRLLTPMRDLLDRAVAEGHGDEDLSALVRLLVRTAG
jgi:3-hydroxyisobutyrate dehydrogenase-like beta-hydroxyacid dehydrogenase